MDLVHMYTSLRRRWYKRPYMRQPCLIDRILIYQFDHALEQRGFTSADYMQWFHKYRVERRKKFPDVRAFVDEKNFKAFIHYRMLTEKARKKLKAVYDKKGRFVDIEVF